MALMKWQPWGGLSSLRREMDRLLEHFEDGFGGDDSPRWERTIGPAVEVSDTPESVMIRAQVPGVSKDEIQVDITDHTLTLHGEFKKEDKQEDKHYFRQEFHYGTFSRTIPLPAGVQAEQAQAKMKDGLLEITIPKSEEAKARAISIQVS